MKRLILIIFTVLSIVSVKSQNYIRYYMNDSTYNGFYSSNVKCIDNNEQFTSINTFTGNINIPIENIDSVVIENLNIKDDTINNSYRIYLFNNDDPNISVKTVFIDNRTNFIASKNGDFGVNDTILIASKYQGYNYLITTNKLGQISKIFDGKRLLYFDFDENCIELTKDGYIEHPEFTEQSYKNNANSKSYSLNNINRVEQVGKFLSKNKKYLSHVDEVFDVYNTSVDNLINNIDNIANNPSLRKFLIGGDVISIAGDIISISAGIGAAAGTAGVSGGFVVKATASLIADILSLFDDLFPDYEQLKKYQDYYQKKYNISLKVFPAENIKVDAADLKGEFSISKDIEGNLFFTLSDYSTGTNVETQIPVNLKQNSDNNYAVSANANGLKFSNAYFYDLTYTCNVDGLSFTYISDSEYFTTLQPYAITGEGSSSNHNSAVVKATFFNIPSGATCGIQYEMDGNIQEATGSAKDGVETEITLNGLKASRWFRYRAFIKVNGQEFLGGEKTYKTELPDITGTWSCKEKHIDSDGSIRYETYTITLKDDGSVEHSEINGTMTQDGLKPLEGNWSLNSAGYVFIGICQRYVSSGSYFSSTDHSWTGYLDLDNPIKIIGQKVTTQSAGNGWHDHGPWEVEMIK